MLINGDSLIAGGFTSQFLLEQNQGRADEKRVQEWMEKYERFRRSLEDRNLVVALGSARNKVIKNCLQVFASTLHRGYVDNQIASGTGHGDSGYMLMTSRSVIEAWDNDEERAFNAPLFGVPLLFQGATTEEKFRPTEFFPDVAFLRDTSKRRKAVICSPGHLTLSTRTPCLFNHKKIAAQIYYPGGWGTTEEFATSSVGHQLKDGIATCHNGALYPPLRFLVDDHFNDHSGRGRWFYQGMLDHLYNMCELGTADYHHIEDLTVVRIADSNRTEHLGPIPIKYFDSPSRAADYVLERTIDNTLAS